MRLVKEEVSDLDILEGRRKYDQFVGDVSFAQPREVARPTKVTPKRKEWVYNQRVWPPCLLRSFVSQLELRLCKRHRVGALTHRTCNRPGECLLCPDAHIDQVDTP